ncbi:MAG: hypothetical protein WBB29_18610 [Geitlerinemataceae cyanobacterium]
MSSMREIPSATVSLDALTFNGLTNVDPFLLRQYIVAQKVDDPQLFNQVQSSWSNFVSSGQIWALLIGLLVGYWFRSMSSG